MKRLLLSLALVVTTVAPALADPKSDLMGALIKLGHAKSYHVEATDKGKVIDMDMEPPAKMHMTMGTTMEMIKIDSDMYMKMGGTWRKFNIPGADAIVNMYKGSIDKYSHPTDDFVVTDLGPKVVGGVPLHGYTVKNKSAEEPVTMYLDGGGMIARMEAGAGAVMTFSKFNEPMNIAAPL